MATIVSSILVTVCDLYRSPVRALANAIEGPGRSAAITMFLGMAVLTFAKSFFVANYSAAFWDDVNANNIMRVLGNAQVRWATAYMAFFLFVFCLVLASGIIARGRGRVVVVTMLLSVSSFGFTVQACFWVLSSFLGQRYLYLLSIPPFLWVLCLYVIAVRMAMGVSVVKAGFVCLLSAFPAFVLSGSSGVAPFLMWLTMW